MEAISLKLPEELLEDSARCAEALNMSRAAYLRMAIERMNGGIHEQIRGRRMMEASRKVRGESLKVNAEFAAVEQDPDV